MHAKTKKALYTYGLDTDLIDRVSLLNHNVGVLQSMGRTALEKYYSAADAATIADKIHRKPIEEDVIDAIMSASGGCCCVCADGNAASPNQLHHIVPHCETQDNSAGNLALVCPTHHVAFHTDPWSQDRQKKCREEWYAVHRLATDFKSRGVPFPFGAFEGCDFSQPPDFRELADLAPLAPATAMESCPSTYAAEAKLLLSKHRCLFVMGASGSGKSAYALGLAGLIARDRSATVFRYVRRGDGAQGLSEISAAIGVAVKPAVMIIDDINAWSTPEIAERIESLVEASTKVVLLITVSGDDAGEFDRFARPHRASQGLTWDGMREDVTANLLTHETTIISVLNGGQHEGVGGPGFGAMSVPLSSWIAQHASGSKTIFEFIFQLLDPRAGAREAAHQLTGPEREYQPVLVAAFEQLAGFERAVTTEDVEAVLAQLPMDPAGVIAKAHWIGKVFESAVRKRIMTKNRGTYTTIHRRWAADFLDECLLSPATMADARALLFREFGKKPADPLRLLRLWSWLDSRQEGAKFLEQWHRSVSAGDWIEYCRGMAEAGVECLGTFSWQHHRRAVSAIWPTQLRIAFETNEDLVATALNAARSHDWHFISQLFGALKAHIPDLLPRIVAKWDPRTAANLIAATPAWAFERMSGALVDAKVAQPMWLQQVKPHMGWQALRANLDSVDPGQVEHVTDIFGVVRVLELPLMRSSIRDVFAAVRRVLKGCSLDELSVDPLAGDFAMYCLIFDTDARNAFDSVDQDLWAKEIAAGPPRRWEKLAEFGAVDEWAGGSLLQSVFGRVNLDMLEMQLQRFGSTYPQETRLLIHYLRGADESLKAKIADIVFPILNGLLKVGYSDASRFLVAFHCVDPVRAALLSITYGVSFPNGVTDRHAMFTKQRGEFAGRDRTESDYAIDLSFANDPTVVTAPAHL